MSFQEADRAQSVMVGTVLLFAILVVAFSLYQATVVPDENRAVEFNAYLDGSADMTELRNGLLDAAQSNTQRGVTVRTGTRYPARALFVNPPPASGRLSTGAEGHIELRNVRSVSAAPNVDAYLETEGRTLSYATRDVIFDPGFREFSASDVRISNGLTYRNGSQPVTLSTFPVVRGNQITLLSLSGDPDASGLTTDITVEPVSGYTRTIGVTNASAGPITVTLPTDISPESLTDIIEGQERTDHLLGVASGPRPGTVNVTLEPSTTYELRVARLEIRGPDSTRAAEDPAPRYLVGSADDVLEEGDDGRVKLTVEARDRYNNPRSNAAVTFNASVGDFEDRSGTVIGSQSATVRTDEDGTATVWYNASVFGLQTVDAFLGDAANESLSPEKQVSYTVRTTGSDGSGAEAGSGEGGLFLYLEDISVEPDSETITWTVNNTGSDLNLTGVQLAFVVEFRQAERGGTGGNGPPGGGGANPFVDGPTAITDLWVNDAHREVSATERLDPDFSFDPVTVRAGENTVVTGFDRDVAVSDQNTVLVRYHLFFEGGISATYDQVVIVE